MRVKAGGVGPALSPTAKQGRTSLTKKYKTGFVLDLQASKTSNVWLRQGIRPDAAAFIEFRRRTHPDGPEESASTTDRSDVGIMTGPSTRLGRDGQLSPATRKESMTPLSGKCAHRASGTTLASVMALAYFKRVALLELSRRGFCTKALVALPHLDRLEEALRSAIRLPSRRDRGRVGVACQDRGHSRGMMAPASQSRNSPSVSIM